MGKADCNHLNVERPHGYRTGNGFEWCADCGALRVPVWGAWRTPDQTAVTQLQSLMAEAVRDFHGKSVLFSNEFLEAAGGEPMRTTDKGLAAAMYAPRPVKPNDLICPQCGAGLLVTNLQQRTGQTTYTATLELLCSNSDCARAWTEQQDRAARIARGEK